MKQRNKGVSNLMEMKKQEQKDRIPEFTSVEEEAAFWESYDLADYWEEFQPEEAAITMSFPFATIWRTIGRSSNPPKCALPNISRKALRSAWTWRRLRRCERKPTRRASVRRRLRAGGYWKTYGRAKPRRAREAARFPQKSSFGTNDAQTLTIGRW